MDKYHEREKAYEDKFVHEAEIEFKIITTAHKNLGVWAAKKMQFENEQLESYVQDIINRFIDQQENFDSIIQKITNDYTENNIMLEKKDIVKEYNKLRISAYNDVMNK